MGGVNLDPVGGARVIGGQIEGGGRTFTSQDIFGFGGQIAGTAQRSVSRGGRLTPPLLQGGAAIRRIRERGASLQPGQGQGFLGSIQARADPDAFNQLLMTLVGGNGLRGR